MYDSVVPDATHNTKLHKAELAKNMFLCIKVWINFGISFKESLPISEQISTVNNQRACSERACTHE